jgi:hypothetical protein
LNAFGEIFIFQPGMAVLARRNGVAAKPFSNCHISAATDSVTFARVRAARENSREKTALDSVNRRFR